MFNLIDHCVHVFFPEFFWLFDNQEYMYYRVEYLNV